MHTAVVVAMAAAAGCSNTPYPGGDEAHGRVYYSSFSNPPKDLDPQVSYTSSDGAFLSLCYERLLGYRFLERPVKLVPELAVRVPEAEEMVDEAGNLTGIRYVFEIHRGVHFIDDACFPDGAGRELKAADFAFVFKRIADPGVNCPVFPSLNHIKGLSEYRARLETLRKEWTREKTDQGEDEDEVRLSVTDLYQAAGEIEGVHVTGDYTFELVLKNPYPQILYWLAMRFVSAVPWEAVSYYDGSKGSVKGSEPLEFGMRPVGTGAYKFNWGEYNREAKIVLDRNENWWGFGETAVPDVTRFPAGPGSDEDVEIGIWTAADAGRKLGRIDRIEWYLEREGLSRFSKFVQGYYDSSGIPSEAFDHVIQEDELTPEMEAKGIRLVKDLGIDFFYIGFNMDDDTIGAPLRFKDPALEAKRESELERSRNLRQAMSLAIDTKECLRIFYNSLGVPAQSPVPPGIFGYDPDYRNPYRQFDPELTVAKQRMEEAGYTNGIDPATGEPLRLTFDTSSTDTRARTLFNFYIDAWKRLGINVELAATDYNKFQQKMEDGNFQVFPWGWLADYPDPENFLFLLYGKNSTKYGPHNPNHSRFENARYDELFKKMENLPDVGSATWTDAISGQEVTLSRGEIIRAMQLTLQEECPLIPNSHSERYMLFHAWLKHIKPHPLSLSSAKYLDVDMPQRTEKRQEWNQPVHWPAYVAVVIVVAFLLPGIVTVRKERR